jgi:hypothetical protein
VFLEVKKEAVVRRGQLRVFQNFAMKICQVLVRNGRLVRRKIQESF